MGTNYDLHIPGSNACEHCGRSDNEEVLHVGKSSCGWTFSLHVYPERGIHDLDDWRVMFEKGTIINEYGERVTVEEMLDTICNRSGRGFKSEGEAATFYSQNHGAPGPNGLTRHALDGRFCVRHGSGTWDCLVGEFS